MDPLSGKCSLSIFASSSGPKYQTRCRDLSPWKLLLCCRKRSLLNGIFEKRQRMFLDLVWCGINSSHFWSMTSREATGCYASTARLRTKTEEHRKLVCPYLFFFSISSARIPRTGFCEDVLPRCKTRGSPGVPSKQAKKAGMLDQQGYSYSPLQ